MNVYKREARTIEIIPFTVMLGILFLVIVFSFMKGGKRMDSLIGIDFCSTSFWLFMFGFMVLMLSINVATGVYLNKQHKLKEQLDYEYDEHDLIWETRNILIISIVGLISGTAAGLLGIGGGALMGPIMLKLNVRPEVSVATSSFLVAFTSSIAILQYASSGRIILDYSLWLIGLSMLGAIIGVLGLKRLSEKYERPSLLVLILGVIMALAALLVLFYGVITMVEDVNNSDVDYGFSGYC